MSLQQAITNAIGMRTEALVGVVSAPNGSKVDVTVRGATLTLSKLASYASPAAGDNVLILAYGATMIVLGSIG